MLATMRTKSFLFPSPNKIFNRKVFKTIILHVISVRCETWFLTLRKEEEEA